MGPPPRPCEDDDDSAPEGAEEPPPLGPGLADLLDEIEATDEQRETFAAIWERAHSEMGAAMRLRFDGHRAVMDELRKDEPDAKAMHATIDDAFGSMKTVAHKRLDDFIEAAATLSPEQKAILRTGMAERKAAHRSFLRERIQALRDLLATEAAPD
jgi:Spy/CpxP family protein refolding chaperone